MKKTTILLTFIGFSLVGFSQTTISNNDGNNVVVKSESNPVSSDYSKIRVTREGEKIQITEDGVVKHKKTFAPQYPMPMVDPEKQSVKNNVQPQND